VGEGGTGYHQTGTGVDGMKILVCIYRTLGDVILGSTLIAELREKYPDCEITFAVAKEYAELLDKNPAVKGLVLTEDHDVVLYEATQDKYDLVLFPAQLTQTDSCWHHNEKYRHGHLVDFYAGRCGIEITKRETYMFPDEADVKRAAMILSGQSPIQNIIVHTQSRVVSKDWHLFGEFVEALHKKYPAASVIQVGGPDDTKCGADVDLCGKLSYSEIAALCGLATLFVGIDSGLAYIADSMACECILIMGMSTESTSGPISGRPTFIEPERPEGCEWACHTNCEYNNPCIRTITVEEVMKHVEGKIGGAENDEGKSEAGAGGSGEEDDSAGGDGHSGQEGPAPQA